MVKKNWEMPEVMELGLNQTKCDEGLVGEEELIGEEYSKKYICEYCGKKFRHESNLKYHIKLCHPNKDHLVGDMLPGLEEGGPAPTFS